MQRVIPRILATLLTAVTAGSALAQGRIEGAPVAVDGGAVTGKWTASARVRAYLGLPFAAWRVVIYNQHFFSRQRAVNHVKLPAAKVGKNVVICFRHCLYAVRVKAL